ncbi:MAG: DUF1840 domain-containing protein [Gammaproteobacteria bacterium]
MFVTFTSRAAAEVLMYKEHAKRILDLLHKDVEQGVITAEEAPRAIQILENEIAEARAHAAAEEIKHDVETHHNDERDDNEHEEMTIVSFGARAFPLLEMLRAARETGYDVMWGV